METTDKVYFPNLNGLRFLLAVFISVFHTDRIKLKYGRENINSMTHMHYKLPIGGLAVTTFFVLSGFLITYLLLKEREKTGTINMKNFYKRRILRIWPLYFFIVLLGFVAFPYLDRFFSNPYSEVVHTHFWLKFIGSLFFLPPYFFTSSHLPQTIGPLWSIRVEEAFYMCWPLLLIRTKNYMKLFLGLIIGLVVIRVGVDIAVLVIKPAVWTIPNVMLLVLKQTLFDYRFSSMAIGAIGAYILAFKKEKILSFIYRKDIQLAVYATTLLMLIFDAYIPFIYSEVFSVLFCIIILNLATNANTIVNLNYKWMDYLGKAAFGIYLYNAFTRVICLEWVEHLYGREISGWQMETLLFTSALALTIILAILSYEFLEKPFLKLKKRFTIIPTEQV